MIVSIQCHFSQVTWSKFIHSAQDFSCEHQVNSVNQLCLQHILCRGDVKNWDVILTAHDLLSCNQQSSSSHVMKSAAVNRWVFVRAGRQARRPFVKKEPREIFLWSRYFVPALCEHFPILLSDTLVTRCISHLYQSYWDEYRWEKHLVTTSKGRYIELPGQLKKMFIIFLIFIYVCIYTRYIILIFTNHISKERESRQCCLWSSFTVVQASIEWWLLKKCRKHFVWKPLVYFKP